MNSDTQRATHIRSRIRDYVLYVVITFAFIGTGIVVDSKWGNDAFIRWHGLTGFTAGLFGYFISNSGQFLREKKFWVLTAILLLVHLAGFIIVLSHVDEWRLTWFIGMAIEYPVLVFFRSRLPNPSQESET